MDDAAQHAWYEKSNQDDLRNLKIELECCDRDRMNLLLIDVSDLSYDILEEVLDFIDFSVSDVNSWEFRSYIPTSPSLNFLLCDIDNSTRP